MWHIIVSLITGAIVGWLAAKIMGSGETSLLMNIFLGIVGGFVGSALFRIIGFVAVNGIANLAVSVIGACIVIWFVRKIR